VPTWATILLIVGILVICALGIFYVIIVGKRRREERAAKEKEKESSEGKAQEKAAEMPIPQSQPSYSQYSRELALGLM
jgi:flagellar biosynthesis/type III secretory pathway M-ring protein FliF/YscJ